MTTRDNKLTPGSNMLWESSRMMLPEHKERLIRHRQELEKEARPLLDEQRVEELACAIAAALRDGTPLRLIVYDDGRRVEVDCVVQQLDPHLRRLKICSREGRTWVPLDDVLGAEPAR